MKDSNIKEMASQSIFGTGNSSAMEQIRKERVAQQKRRRRIVLLTAIPLLLLLAAGVAFYFWHEKMERERYIQAMKVAEGDTDIPRIKQYGYEKAKMTVECLLADESQFDGLQAAILFDALGKKPSEILIKFNFANQKQIEDPNTVFAISINGNNKFNLPQDDGTVKEVGLTIRCTAAELCEALNQAHAQIYGKVRVPLRMKATSYRSPNAHLQDKPETILDTLTLPGDPAASK